MMNGRRAMRRCVGTAAALVLAAFAMALPARADVILHERFDDSFSEDFDNCGLALHRDLAFRGVTHLRVGKGDLDSAFLLLLSIKTTETITNLENGRFFVIEGTRQLHDVSATRVEGSVFRFTTIEAGQPFVVRDMSGEVVLRDRGVIRTTILFDTLGDETPGGEFLDEIDVEVRGPHPGFFLDDEQFCELVLDLIG